LTENLTPKKRRAIEALFTCPDITAAAKQAGISRGTMYRWMKEPAFLEALNNASLQALEGLSRKLLNLGGKAAETLRVTLDDDFIPAGARIRAADIVLSRILQLQELVELNNRVSELERRINHDNQKAD